MAYQAPLQVKYKRPRSLSDPYHDFTVEITQAILGTQDVNLTWRDFKSILGPFLPAGTYEQSVYFLPLAFDHIWNNMDDALDLSDSIAWFISEYHEKLSQDKLLDACRDRIRELLSKWVSRFEVTHFDRDACQAKGWTLAYMDYVGPAEALCEMLCRLIEFEAHADIAINFFKHLTEGLHKEMGAAWFIELWRAQGDVHHPPNDPRITVLLNDTESLRLAAETVRRSQLINATQSPTYWPVQLAAIEQIIQ